MEVGEVMTKDVSWVTPDARLPDIARRMRDEDIGSVPVAEDDRLVGMVTDRDIVLRAVADGVDLDRVTAREVMSTGPVRYCFADESVEHVLENMGGVQVRRLPVVNRDKRLVGIVSLGDLSRGRDGLAGAALREIAEAPPSPAGNGAA